MESVRVTLSSKPNIELRVRARVRVWVWVLVRVKVRVRGWVRAPPRLLLH